MDAWLTMPMLKPIETFALAKAIKDKARDAARDQLTEGVHKVDFTVRVHGPIVVPPPAPWTEREDVEPRRIIALLLEKLAPRVRAQVTRYIDASFRAWRAREIDEPMPAIPALLEEADHLLSFAHRERETTRRGTVSAPLTLDLVKK